MVREAKAVFAGDFFVQALEEIPVDPDNYRTGVVARAASALHAALSREGLESTRVEHIRAAWDPRAGERLRDCEECPELAVVPSGSFLMGSPRSEDHRDGNEGPVHPVNILAPFAAGVYEVTREEYAAFVAETGHVSGRIPNDDSHRYVCYDSDEDGEWRKRPDLSWRNPGYDQSVRDPVVCVDWVDAQAYVRWLSGKTGQRYRLLSEAEWEYAARAGTETRYHFGDVAAESLANYGRNVGRTTPAGSYRANGFGLHDMHGNVGEFAQDCWNESYEGAPATQVAWESGNCSRRIVRGGAWSSPPRDLRSANRRWAGTRFRSIFDGFRVARMLEQSSSTVTNGAISSRLFVPIVLRATGRGGAFYTSELTLTNRGSRDATLQHTYTAAIGSGSGTAMDFLVAGEQRIIPDAIAYLRSLGVPIRGSSAGGTLVVDFSNLTSASDAAVTVRTSTPVEGGRGRAGLAYLGLKPDSLFTRPTFIAGLRQNSQDRSNVAVQHAGDSSDGDIVLRVTVFSGDSASAGRRVVLPHLTLAPGGFHQYNSILNTSAARFENGYVKVERVSGAAAYYAYGVINDQVNSDGSFVFPVREDSLEGRRGQTLPVIVETGTFTSELAVTNFSASDKTVEFRFVAEAVETDDDTASFSLRLRAGGQRIIPDIVEASRRQGVEGIGRANRAFVGAVFATVAEGDMSGIVIGARTGSPGGGGQYGLFYNAVPYGSAFGNSAWIYGMQQNGENRSNLALVNTGEIDDSSSTFEITVYDGSGESQPRTKSVTLAPWRWTQINGILGSTSQGYVQVRKTSGNNPFITYGVINDGGRPGERSGDGAFLPAEE